MTEKLFSIQKLHSQRRVSVEELLLEDTYLLAWNASISFALYLTTGHRGLLKNTD